MKYKFISNFILDWKRYVKFYEMCNRRSVNIYCYKSVAGRRRLNLFKIQLHSFKEVLAQYRRLRGTFS